MPIHPTAQIEPGAQIHETTEIGPWCIIGNQAKIGARTKLYSHVCIDGDTDIGMDNDIYPFCVLGTAPQHTKCDGQGTQLIIGDHNKIREYVVIHRAIKSHGKITKVGDHNMFMLGTHLGHDVQIGSHIICAPHTLIGGHVWIEDYVTVGGNASVHQFSRIGKYAMVGAQFLARRDLIPYGLINSPDSRNLAGLNIIGMRRRGFTRSQISNVQKAYNILFLQTNTMEQGNEIIKTQFYDCSAVAEIIRFLDHDSIRHYIRPNQSNEISEP